MCNETGHADSRGIDVSADGGVFARVGRGGFGRYTARPRNARHSVGHRLALHRRRSRRLHCKEWEGLPIYFGDTRFDDLCNARVLQSAENLHFELETALRATRTKMLVHHFQCNPPLRVFLTCFEYRTHSTGRDQLGIAARLDAVSMMLGMMTFAVTLCSRPSAAIVWVRLITAALEAE